MTRAYSAAAMRRASTIVIASLLATPAAADVKLPCLWNPFGGCSFSFVSPEYAKFYCTNDLGNEVRVPVRDDSKSRG